MSDLFNPELYVSDVSVYYGSKCAVQNVSFDIQPGQLTAIIGNNGCGKTSLIRAVMNLVKHSGKCMLGELQSVYGTEATEYVCQKKSLHDKLHSTKKWNKRKYDCKRCLSAWL